MSNVTDTETRPGFRRCAVGKIDLKGRFVYVDDEIEQLLGYTKEELFGCHLVDFLDEPSRTLIEQVLTNRNHYESFYDATVLTLLSKTGLPVSARAIVTLNFIAGNPVNFQLIMEAAEKSASSADSPGANHLPVEEFIDGLLQAGPGIKARDLLSLIREFTGAVQGSLYLVSGDQLEPRAGSSADGSLEFAFRDIPEPADLHRRIASEGSEYAFTEVDSTSDASSPNEYVSLLPRPDGESYLLRLIFDRSMSDASASAAVDRARLALKLWQHEVDAVNAAGERADAGIDIQFTVGFLDHLGIGSALIDAHGAVVGYNRTLTEMIQAESPGDDYAQLLQVLTGSCSNEVGQALRSHFSARAEGTRTGDLKLQVELPEQKTTELVAVALSDHPGDLSTCLVLVPQRSSSEDTDLSGDASSGASQRSVLPL